MNLQERIDFILNKNFPASVKRKHLIHLIQHLGYYSDDADELGIAYIVISEAIEKLDNESSSLNQAHEFKSRKYDKGADGSMITDLYESHTRLVPNRTDHSYRTGSNIRILSYLQHFVDATSTGNTRKSSSLS